MIRTLHTDSRPEDRVRPPRPIHPDECRPGVTPDDYEPSFVRYRGPNVVEVWSRLGPDHINCRLASARLQRRGLRVFTIPAPNTNHHRG